MATIAVSVVMPCRDAARTVEAAVESVVLQKFKNWELIAVDDGSADDTFHLLHQWATRDPRVRPIQAPRNGIVAALNQGCAEARGQYVARMDADDIADPRRLAMQVAFLDNVSEPTLCGTLVETVGEDVGEGRSRYEAWVNSLIEHDAIVRELFVECPIPHPTFMATRDCFQRLGYRDSDWPEDYDFIMRAHTLGIRFGKVPVPLLQWRDHPGRLCLNDARYGLDRFRALKRHYLSEKVRTTNRPFWQWGAGEVGKAWLREWETVRPERVVDVNPRKFNKHIHGYEVVAPEALPGPGAVFIAVAVGAPGARDQIRAWMTDRGYKGSIDFTFIA